MPLLAAFIPALIGFLTTAAASILGSALIGLGIGLVAYTGFSELLSLTMSEIQSRFTSLPPDLTAILWMLQVDTCFSILTSAGVAKMGLNGLRSGTVKRWVTK